MPLLSLESEPVVVSTPVLASRVKVNVAANFLGKAWVGVTSLAFVPLYVRFLGVEAYGLIGVYVALQTIFSLLQSGSGVAFSREVARAIPSTDAEKLPDLLRTMEAILWPFAGVIMLVVAALAPLLAHSWLDVSALPTADIQSAILVMGLGIAFQTPFALYSGGLVGLQRHGILNLILAGTATMKYAGGILVLWLFSPTIKTFFLWQALAELVQTLFARSATWRLVQALRAGRPRLNLSLLRDKWRYAAAISGISLFAPLASQVDKLVISKILPLGMLGYYMIAVVAANGLFYIAYPLSLAVFPRFAELAARSDERDLVRLYHKSCALMSMIMWPSALALAFFAPGILALWTGDPQIVKYSGPVLSILAIGTALNAMTILPHSLQLASGWTRLVLYTNAVATLLLIPLVYVLTLRFGLPGAAAAWIVLNIGYVISYSSLMHRRVLRGERDEWLLHDVIAPLAAAVITIGTCSLLVPRDFETGRVLLGAALAFLLAIAASSAATKGGRRWLLSYWREFAPGKV